MTPPPGSHLELLAEQTRELAIVLLDPRGIVSWWSPGAQVLFGYRPDEILGRPVATLFVPDDVERGVPEHEMAVAATMNAAEDDRWMRRADGSRFWATGVMNVLRDAKGRLVGFGKVLRDRTDLMERLETLRNRNEALGRETRRKDVFLSTLSHELRNPLAPMVHAIELIRPCAQSLPDLATPMGILERQTAALRRMVDDLLDLTRIGAGKVNLQKEELVLQEVLTRAVETVRSQAEQRKQKLELVVPRGPILVQGDPDRLQQVFVNLIHNAIRYTPEQGSIWVTATSDSEAVAAVRDNGIGIPPAMLPHIFELFTQVDRPWAQGQGGLGIGLSVVRDLVALHDGTVQVRSEGPGKGSEFTVRLPRKRPAD